MASQTAGIQKILAAEKRASEKVNEARKRKAQRMKQAKQEAQAEIEMYRKLYRKERENVFKEYEQKSVGTKGDVEAKIREETQAQLEAMAKSVVQHKEVVIVRLLELVCDIRPELHHNLQLQKKLQGQFA
uniref:V-type proton ATPase subunit G n=1 Tax=Steinernema glaseri TaxID=37863 RepID=A0A1I7Z669_9BILA